MKHIALIALVILVFVLVGCGKKDITGKAVEDMAMGDIKDCTDTDGGDNIEEKGTVNGEFSDKCVAGLLIEYYCEGNEPLNQNHRCPDKCVDGACV